MLPDVTVTVGKRMDLQKAGPGTATYTLGSGAEDKRPLNIQARNHRTPNLQTLLNLQASKLTLSCTRAKGSTQGRGDLSSAQFVGAGKHRNSTRNATVIAQEPSICAYLAEPAALHAI